jgi:predicted Zn-dependent protease
MMAWVIGAIAVVLWGWALKKAWGVMMGTGRNIENGHVGQRVREMYMPEAELVERMKENPEEPAYAIKYALAAGENWPELRDRSAQVLKKFPHLLFGYTMLARALSQLGEKDEAEKLVRRGLARYPRDIELGATAFQQAVANGKHRQAFGIIRRLRKEYPEVSWLCAMEFDLLMLEKRYVDAEKLLNKADVVMPGDQIINEAWAKLQAATTAS